MTEPSEESVKKTRVLSLFTSPELRWLYRVVVSFLLLVGVVFSLVGASFIFNWSRSNNSFVVNELFIRGLIYLSIGLLVLIAALGVHQVRRYLLRIQEGEKDEVARIRSIELSKLGEDDFEQFDRVRRLREEKAQRDFERNLNVTFVVQQLEARDVALFSRADWFLQPSVNVLLGRNGYGKSLILRAVGGLLQRDEEATEMFFPGTIESPDSGIDLRIKCNGKEEKIRRNSIRFSESVGKVPLLAIPDARFLDRSQQTIGPDDSDTADLRAYGAYHFLHQKPYISVLQGLLYEICLDYWEHGQKFDLPTFQFLQECVRRLTGFDFRFYSIKRSGRTNFEICVLTEGSQEPIPIQYASQGTLSVLAMFGLIRSYLRALSDKPEDGLVQKGSGIVLIDEADAHLHPVWQQKFPSLLKELFPNVQFILSAHSPLFVAGCWAGEVAVLRRAKPGSSSEGFRIEQLDRDFVGATSTELYQKIFEVEELDDTYLEYATKASLRKEHSARIRDLSERREKKELSQGEEQELRRLLEEGRRIRRVVEVSEQRRQESDKDLRIAELESQVLNLETRLQTNAKEQAP